MGKSPITDAQRATIDRVTQRALDLPAEDRKAYVISECSGDDDVTKEVLVLLEAVDADADPFDGVELPQDAPSRAQPPETGFGSPSEGETQSPEVFGHLPAVGDRIGPYTIRQQIGWGGFGIVFLAQQSAPIRREVALKVIKPGMDTREVVTRFEAERQALAMMSHPGIANVLDAGTTDRGQPYFVMEYVKGNPITTFCDDERLDIGQRLDLFCAVCEAIQHAHTKGVIHRDIKPSNILAGRSDGADPTPFCKVIDFGIAKALHGHRLADSTVFTRLDQPVGTPNYMSPEQVRPARPAQIAVEGDPGSALAVDAVDTRTDVYSLGVVLYELLTGGTPFQLGEYLSDEDRRTIRLCDPPTFASRLSSQSDAQDAAASRRLDVASHKRALRRELEWITFKSLKKVPGERYESPAALARDVRRFLGREAVEAGPDSLWYIAKKTLRRRRGPAIAASLVLASLLLGFTGTTNAMLRAAADRDRFEQRTEELEQVIRYTDERLDRFSPENFGRMLGRQIQPELAARLKQQGELDGVAGPPSDDPVGNAEWLLSGVDLTGLSLDVLREGLFEPEVRHIREAFHDRPLIQAHLLQHFADRLRPLGLQGLAAKAQLDALTIRERNLRPDHPDTLWSLVGWAIIQAELGKLESAEELFERAYQGRRKEFGDDHPDTLTVQKNLGSIKLRRGDFDEAERCFRDVLENQRRVLGDTHPDVFITMISLVALHVQSDRAEEFEEESVDAFESSRDHLGDEHPSTQGLMQELAALYSRTGELDEAEFLLSRLLEIRVRQLGRDHPDTMVTRNNLAVLAYERRDFDAAADQFREMAESRRRLLGPTHPDTLLSFDNLAITLKRSGHHQEAVEILSSSLEVRRRELDPLHPDIIFTTFELADALWELGDQDASIVRHRQALAAAESADSHAQTALIAHNLGSVLQENGELDDAIDAYRRAVAATRSMPGETGPRHARTLNKLGEALMIGGRADEAADYLAEAAVIAITSSDELVDISITILLNHAETLITLGRLVDAESPALDANRVAAALGQHEQELESIRRLVRLYEALYETDGGAGYEKKAALWRSRLGIDEDADFGDVDDRGRTGQ